MKAPSSLIFSVLMMLLVAPAVGEFKKCKTQTTFNVLVCNSHMCSDCSMAWCTEKCQKVQQDNPGCRCKDWKDARKSFSDGDFSGKGLVGDVGEYSKANSTKGDDKGTSK